MLFFLDVQRYNAADDDDERRIEFVAIGERWGSRLAELARRLVPWGATC